MKVAYYTEEGLRALKAELDQLRDVERPRASQAIAEARDKGDLSENAEYDAAKDEQRDIEARIEEIEKILKNAEVFLEEDAEKGTVNLGSTFTLLDMEYDEEIVYKLVGATEANSLEGKISNESPVGRALKGAKEGDIVEVETPAGTLQYKVLKIHK